MRPTWSWPSTGEFPHIVIPLTRNHACVWIITTRKNQSVYHLSRLSLWASILQSLPLVCGASRLPHSFCLMDNGMRNAFGPTKVVMLLAGSIRDVSMHWTSWRDTTGYYSVRVLYVKGAIHNWTQGAASFLPVMSVTPFPHLMNLPLLTGRTQCSNECVMAERTAATAALSDCRLLHLLAAIYRKLCCWKENDWCPEIAVVPLFWCFFVFFTTAGRLMVGDVLCCFCQTKANWVAVQPFDSNLLKSQASIWKTVITL